ncbi:hypothetical protein MLD38_024535 [Melastoma candidum]|uniref:Uncharacterized protein n=1 Tax=Melastoma candidum TaxID=119954 RepID=A0ACB9NVA0_9MYRT|nr:hypothetical protein MLD38_024535 [Melastoma candidum]
MRNSLRQLLLFRPTSGLATIRCPALPATRSLSSEPAAGAGSSDCSAVVGILGKVGTFDETRKELDGSGVSVSRDLVLEVLETVRDWDDAARGFFRWVQEGYKEKVCSRGYNLMLDILGRGGDSVGFWGLYEEMKGKGYGVSRRVRDGALERFKRDGLVSDVEKLRELFSSGSIDNSDTKVASRISKLVRSEVWNEDLELKLKEMNAEFSGDVVRMVVEKLSDEPMKSLIFFRWLQESLSFKPDAGTYNAMAVVLGREDCIDRFWNIASEMRAHGFEMAVDTYAQILGRFFKRKLIKESVALYEFAVEGKDKPSASDTTYLLKKIVVAKDLDLELFSRVIKVFTQNGNQITDPMVNSVLKSLSSVGRFRFCNEVLKIMEEVGFVIGGSLRSKIAFHLGSRGNLNEADELMTKLALSADIVDPYSWAALVEGYSISGNLEEASRCFQRMVEKEGGSSAATAALHSLVNGYCNSKRVTDAYRLLQDCTTKSELKPAHPTYKLLIKKSLDGGHFDDALSLLGMMKLDGYPPFLDPVFHHVSRKGNGDSALAFMKAVTSKKFPSSSVFLQMFEAFFNANRHYEAQDFLSKCPRHIRDHADVLTLFYSRSKRKVATKPDVVVA